MSNVSFGRGDAAAVPQTRVRHNFIFTGTGKEFFGIWIVNLLLTIVTLGIYSAWAKVRTKRYFNGNTILAGHSFDYHANPVAILKGRIIVVVVLIVLNLLSQVSPFLAIPILIFYAIALPWVIVRGLRFNANMTSYRNVRFGFNNTKWNAFKAYIAWPFLAILSLGILQPFASRANARFLGDGHSYGSSEFFANPPLKPYYNALGIVALMIVVPIACLVGFGVLSASGSTTGMIAQIGITTFIVLLYAAIISGLLIYTVYSRNIGFGNLHLKGGHSFESNVKVKSYIWIIFSNFLLTLVTIGLYIPWAKVRLARYLADHTAMIAKGDLDQFAASQIDQSGVASGEFLDIEGIDFGF